MGPTGKSRRLASTSCCESRSQRPQLAVLIKRDQLTIRGEGTGDHGDAVPRENRGVVIQQVLVVVPLEATQIGLL